MPAEKFEQALLRPLKSRTLGDFEGVVTLGVAKASKPIFPIRGGRFLREDARSESRTVAALAAQKVGRSLRWPLRKSDGRSAGRSEIRTVAPLAAQKFGRSLRWPLRKSDGRSAGRSKVGRWGISRGW
jgi:hypothetical protein